MKYNTTKISLLFILPLFALYILQANSLHKEKYKMATTPNPSIVSPTYTGLIPTGVILNNVPALSVGGNVTPNQQVQIGSSAVNLVYNSGRGQNINQNTISIILTGQNGAIYSVPLPEQPIPSSGQSVSAGGFTVTNTGSTIYSSISGQNEPVFSIQANSSVAVNNYYILLYSTPNNAPPVGAVFDVISATPTSPATSLNIDRALSNLFTTGLTTFTSVTPSTNYTDSTLSPNTSYYYRYTQVNSTGTSPGPYSIVTTPFVTTLTGINVMYIPGNCLQVTWANPTPNPFTGINVYRLGKSANGVFQRDDANPLQQLPPNSTVFNDFSVGHFDAFSYYIVGVINGIEQANSAVVGPVAFFG